MATGHTEEVPVVMGPGKGEIIEAAGVHVEIKTPGEATAGGWTVLEYTAPPGFRGPPPHYHKETLEAFYLLEGELTATIDGTVHTLTPGDHTFIPTGVIHSFSNPSQGKARFLLLVSPGGFENYFRELEALIAEQESWPPEDMSKIAALQAKYDTHPPPR